MRDYIILNGVNSNTITGLLISTLPPITKPKKRTQIEEIDGKDGDIVTTLGYSAYDKEFEIGLYGDFDIDDVIAYFNSEGTVTFSNEPDKYYNYQILDQIDYEKLIRFKKAKIRMHVQPFKYPLEETPVEITIQTVSGEGETIDLDNTSEAPMTIALKGNTSQDGTPTPEAPVEISVVSGDNSIEVSNGTQSTSYPINLGDIELCKIGTYQDKIDKSSGKNLLRTNIPTQTINGMTITNNGDGSYTLNGTTTASTSFVDDGTKWYTLSQGTYYVSCNDFTNITLAGYYGSGTLAFWKTNQGTFSLPTDVDRFRFQITINNGITLSNKRIYPMINEGTTALPYEPYGTGWYLKKEIGKVVFNGTETWWNATQILSSNFYRYENQDFRDTTKYMSRTKYVSNYFKFSNNNNTTENIIVNTNSEVLNRLWIIIDTTYMNGTTENDFKNWLSTHNTTVYHVLATPTYEYITDTTLISQLEALANATSYYPETHITQTNDDKPFILNATAFQFGEATVNNEGNIYSKPTLDIEGSGTVGIYLEGNQIFSIDLSNSSECVIDTTQLEAYNPTTSELMNRQVTGDYSNFKLNAGDNQVEATGNITKVTISNYTRWL